VSLELVQSAVSSEHHLPILLGSSLPHFDGLNFKLGKEKFVFNGQAVMPGTNGKVAVLAKVVNKFMRAPYLWGGRSPFGVDCSGFTQVVFKTLGIRLPRDSHQQAACGNRVDFVPEAKAGDIAFFENKEGRIAHAGIIVDTGQIAHAYGHVRLDRLDHQGIYNNELKEYTHRLRVIKRLF
jgi:cell wall-associated NlpC family hydrolase